MIIILTGGIGSGKTLSAVKSIVDRKNKIFTNFVLNNIKHTRLKYEHLIKKEIETTTTKGGKESKIKKEIYRLNYEFWNKEVKKGGFDIFLDEFHNLMGSRRSMSKRNVLLSDWLSQIRKILGESELNNLYLITQKLRRIDVNSRDLAHLAVKCEKQTFKNVLIPTEIMKDNKLITKRIPLVVIYKSYYADADALNAEELYGAKTCIGKSRFIGNPYFKHFNSYELINFGSEEYV